MKLSKKASSRISSLINKAKVARYMQDRAFQNKDMDGFSLWKSSEEEAAKNLLDEFGIVW